VDGFENSSRGVVMYSGRAAVISVYYIVVRHATMQQCSLLDEGDTAAALQSMATSRPESDSDGLCAFYSVDVFICGDGISGRAGRCYTFCALPVPFCLPLVVAWEDGCHLPGLTALPHLPFGDGAWEIIIPAFLCTHGRCSG
jgi:hypothetical protein